MNLYENMRNYSVTNSTLFNIHTQFNQIELKELLNQEEYLWLKLIVYNEYYGRRHFMENLDLSNIKDSIKINIDKFSAPEIKAFSSLLRYNCS